MSRSGSQSGGRGTPSRGPRSTPRSGPGRAPGQRPGRARPPVPVAATPPRPRPRLTSRAAVLVLIVAVLAVSYASSLRAYLQQRDHIEDAQARIAASEASIASLEREKERHGDPAYIEQQAKARLGYVRPGDTPFVVIRDGEPLDVEGELTDPDSVAPTQEPAWWDEAWDTMLVAGDPPRRTDPPPETKISDPEGAPVEEEDTE